MLSAPCASPGAAKVADSLLPARCSTLPDTRFIAGVTKPARRSTPDQSGPQPPAAAEPVAA